MDPVSGLTKDRALMASPHRVRALRCERYGGFNLQQ
jgi:hypothetical protein